MSGTEPGAGPAIPADAPPADCRAQALEQPGRARIRRQGLAGEVPRRPGDADAPDRDSCMERDQFDEALPYVQKARAQKPLDQSLRNQESFIHIGLARMRALAGRWDEGRDQFRAAEELSPELRSQYSLPCPQGALRGESQPARSERPISARSPRLQSKSRRPSGWSSRSSRSAMA